MRNVLAGLVALGAIVAASVVPAHADPTQFPIGRKCGFSSHTDVTAEPQTQAGIAYAGPLVSQASGTFACQVYVNGVAAASARVEAHTTATGVVHVAVLAGLISYHSYLTDVIDECTLFHGDDGTDLWWHVAADTTDVLGSRWETGTPTDTSLCGSATTIACAVQHGTRTSAGTDVVTSDCPPYAGPACDLLWPVCCVLFPCDRSLSDHRVPWSGPARPE
jgi:hypothetical protein